MKDERKVGIKVRKSKNAETVGQGDNVEERALINKGSRDEVGNE